MYKNILVCLDGSEQDQQVIRCGIWLAKTFEATLHALHVKDLLSLEGPLLYDISGALALIPQMNVMEETRKLLEEKGKQILKNFEKICEEEKVAHKAYLEEGIVYRTILEKASLHDLTLLGRRGRNFKLDQDLLGSTADRVVRRIKTPALVITHEFQPIHSPLLAYDGSSESKEALLSSAPLLGELKVPLTVVHVSKEEADARDLFNEVRDYLEPYHLKVRYEWLTGTPRQQIPDYAKRHQHDLLVLGARGDRLVDLLLGSTTLYALWQGSCHVWVDR